MIAKIIVVTVFALLMLVIGLLRARYLGISWRETAWPGLTVAATLYLIGNIIASIP